MLKGERAEKIMVKFSSWFRVQTVSDGLLKKIQPIKKQTSESGSELPDRSKLSQLRLY